MPRPEPRELDALFYVQLPSLHMLYGRYMVHSYGSYLRKSKLNNEIRQYMSLDRGPWLLSDVISPKLGSPFGYLSREVCTPQYSFQRMFS